MRLNSVIRTECAPAAADRRKRSFDAGEGFQGGEDIKIGLPAFGTKREPRSYYRPGTEAAICRDEVQQFRSENCLSLVRQVGKVHFRTRPKIWEGEQSAWARYRQIAATGAILVRPDRYIAWRSNEGHASPKAEIAKALEKILGLRSWACPPSTQLMGLPA